MPCPFCGKKVRFNFNIDFGIDGIWCPTCHAMTRFPKIKDNGIENIGVIAEKWAGIWNRRAGK